MAIYQSGRIVHLDQSGNVIWEEWPNPSDKMLDEQSEVIAADWFQQTTPRPVQPIGDPVMRQFSREPKDGHGFGYDNSLRRVGKHYRRFGIKA